ncbi:MAG: NAD(+) synthase [Gemmataceae bacterium]
MQTGLFRVAVFSPRLHLAMPLANAQATINLMKKAQAEDAGLALFPELNLTGYTCGDLFHTEQLLQESILALELVLKASKTDFSGIVIVGLPLRVADQVYNVAAILQNGILLGIVPKSHLPTYKEFYERRYFSPATNLRQKETDLLGVNTPIGTDLLFTARDFPELRIGVEICEDLWVAIPPSCHQALAGATLLLNLSASNELVGKAAYRKNLVLNQSARCMAAYVYSSCGTGESTTDLVFGGHCMIAENGSVLAENQRFSKSDSAIIGDVDLEKLVHERGVTTTWGDNACQEKISFRQISFNLKGQGLISDQTLQLHREIIAHPFVPANPAELDSRCREIFQIQVTGLAKRLETLGNLPITIGISGGLDSTLALIVATQAMQVLGRQASDIHGVTMPGFGTSTRTLQNARKLMLALGVNSEEIDIRQMCLDEMKALGHAPFGIKLDQLSLDAFQLKLELVSNENKHDLVFENIQARRRTSLLMNKGFVIGTGDLSELALGWCTFNADHMSMYNPNASIPKTLVKFLVTWAAHATFEEPVSSLLKDIAQTVISPELLPLGKDQNEVQSTEASVGPYELHDFFLYHFLRFGYSRDKILFYASRAKFDRSYTQKEISGWLDLFFKRFFTQQYKRSTLPDGPKVGSVSLSPRGDWRMPSDIKY